MFTEGKTPFVSPQDVEREKDRRAQIGLDPDYYTNPIEDLGLMEAAPEVKAARQGRIDDRLQEIQQRNLPLFRVLLRHRFSLLSFKQLK